MPRTMNRRRLASLALASLVLVTQLLGSEPTAAGPIDDKRSEVAQVADRLEQLQVDAEMLAEDYNDARLKLEGLQRRVEAAQKRAETARAKVAARRTEVTEFAVDVYVLGGSADVGPEILAGDLDRVSRKRGYADATIDDRYEVIDRLRSATARAEDQIVELDEAKGAAEQVQALVDRRRRSAEQAVGAQLATERRVRGELADLVRAEEARRAAEEERRATERARQVADQERRAAEQARIADRPTSGADAQARRQPAAAPVDRSNRSAPAAAAEPAPAPPPSVGGGAGSVIAAARSVLGVPYRWAGASPSTGFDCSGFILWAWQHGGKSLPHSSRAMYAMSTKISMSALQPGDLVFYGQPTIHHVALYIGGGQIIHSPSSGSSVRQDSVNYWDELVGAGRI